MSKTVTIALERYEELLDREKAYLRLTNANRGPGRTYDDEDVAQMVREYQKIRQSPAGRRNGRRWACRAVNASWYGSKKPPSESTV